VSYTTVHGFALDYLECLFLLILNLLPYLGFVLVFATFGDNYSKIAVFSHVCKGMRKGIIGLGISI
jgi:hypothetical protein